METNVKMVGFANRSINGVTIANEGFDMEYDGKKMDISGFSGDKLYYAKLNNKQLVNLLNLPSSDVPLERRISLYGKPRKGSLKIVKLSSPRKIKKTKKKSDLRVSKRKSSSLYVTPKLRSEYRKSSSSRHSSKYPSKRNKASKRSSIRKTIY